MKDSHFHYCGELSVTGNGLTLIVPPDAGSFLIINDSNIKSDVLEVSFDKSLAVMPSSGLGQVSLAKDERLAIPIHPEEYISKVALKSEGLTIRVRFIFV